MKKRTTIHDIARQLNVASSTVSRAFNGSGYVRESLKEKILQTAYKMNYFPEAAARSLRTKRTEIIALGVPDIANPFFPEFTRAVQKAAISHGYHLILYNTDGKENEERILVELAMHRHADAIIAFPLALTSKDFLILKKSRIPVVLFDTRLGSKDLDTIVIDDIKGVRLAVEHLLSFGHERIAFVSDSINALASRLAGYREALYTIGFSADDEYIALVEHDPKSIAQGLQRLLDTDPPPTAIFAADDHCAIHVIHEARKLGVRVPQDLSIVGFDNIEASELVSPALTTINQPKYEMGTAAVDIVIKRLEQEEPDKVEHIIFQPTLVVRDSTMTV